MKQHSAPHALSPSAQATSGDEMVLVNEKAGLTIPFRLISSESLPAESYGYEMGELGGFAVDAYMEDGHLMADIYSLSSDEFAIYPEGLLTIDKGSVTAESAGRKQPERDFHPEYVSFQFSGISSNSTDL